MLVIRLPTCTAQSTHTIFELIPAKGTYVLYLCTNTHSSPFTVHYSLPVIIENRQRSFIKMNSRKLRLNDCAINDDTFAISNVECSWFDRFDRGMARE